MRSLSDIAWLPQYLLNRKALIVSVLFIFISFALKFEALPGNVRGGLWMLLAAFFFSVMIALIKVAGQSLHVTEILLWRQLTMIVIATPAILSSFPYSLYTARPGLQMLRIVLAFFAMVLGFTAVIHLPLAEVTAITFSKAFFITVMAVMLLGEVVSIQRWGAIMIGFLGVLVIAWPTGTAAFNLHGLMAITSSACVGAVIIIIRMLSQVDRPVTIMTYQAMGVGILMLPPAIYFWQTPSINQLLLLSAIGIFSALGQYCNIISLKAAEVSVVGPFDYARLIYALLLGLWLFDEWPEPHVFLGAGLIVAAAVYTLQRERARGIGN